VVTTDSLGFLDAVAGLPEQLAAAHEAAALIDADRFPAADGVHNVVVLGMGGSGIAGDVLAATTDASLTVPVSVVKQMEIPGFVGPSTLTFAVSYSGDTDETVTMAQHALDAGARLVAISAGGALGRLAASAGALHVQCPEGFMPRAALGALVAPMFVTLSRMGLLADATDWLTNARDQLARRRDECAPAVAARSNPARELARRIGGTIPLVYGGGALGGVAAMRWKADVNENAKAPAFFNVHPELEHNEICGWGQHGDVTRQLFTLVELRHGYEDGRLARRFEVTRTIIEEAVYQVLEVRAAGEGRLAQLLDLMYMGDWVSCYLALRSEVDPGPIPAIAQLKETLGRG
jgi:glucose/mannose-6-phosphate isomerase